MALYFMNTGTYVILPILWTSLATNVSGHYETGFVAAMQIGLSSFGGVIASLVFKTGQAPWFAAGCFVSFAPLMLATCLMGGLVAGLRLENGTRDHGGRD